MEHWCCQVLLLVLCLGSCVWNVVEADDQNFQDHCCTYYALLDWNGDLVLDDFDFQGLATAIKAIDTSLNVLAKTIQIAELLKQLPYFLPLVDKNILAVTFSGGVSLADFLTNMKEGRYTEDMKGKIVHLVNFIHETFNSQGADMILTKGEFEIVYKAFRIPQSQVETGWNDMDQNGDGVVTVWECNNSARLYFGEAPLESFSNSWAGQTIKCIDLVKGDRSKLPYY